MRKRIPSPALRPNAAPKRFSILLAVVMNAVTVAEPAMLNSTPIMEKARLLYIIAGVDGKTKAAREPKKTNPLPMMLRM